MGRDPLTGWTALATSAVSLVGAVTALVKALTALRKAEAARQALASHVTGHAAGGP